jgi:hypothetical protein
MEDTNMADVRLIELFTNIANAIRNKKGTVGTIKATDFPAEIASIEAGGGSEPTIELERKDVNFYDYEGTLLFSYTLAEAQALTELPTPKGHEGLVFQGWNWDLADVNALEYPMDVGAMYITDDGKTRLYLEIPEILRKGVVLEYYQTKANGVRVDWGDGVTEVSELVGNVSLTHDYATSGNYLVTLEVIVEGCSLELSNRQSNRGIFGVSNVDSACPRLSILKKIHIGNAQFYYSALRRCVSLEEITLPKGMTIPGFMVERCYSLRYLVIPSGGARSELTYLAAYCSTIQGVSVPKGFIIGEWSFTAAYSVKYIQFRQNSLKAFTLTQNRAVGYLDLSSVTDVAANAISGEGLLIADFRKAQQVPTLANANGFSSLNTDMRFVVPDALYDKWVSTDHWSTHESRIIKASDYTK